MKKQYPYKVIDGGLSLTEESAGKFTAAQTSENAFLMESDTIDLRFLLDAPDEILVNGIPYVRKSLLPSDYNY